MSESVLRTKEVKKLSRSGKKIQNDIKQDSNLEFLTRRKRISLINENIKEEDEHSIFLKTDKKGNLQKGRNLIKRRNKTKRNFHGKKFLPKLVIQEKSPRDSIKFLMKKKNTKFEKRFDTIQKSNEVVLQIPAELKFENGSEINSDTNQEVKNHFTSLVQLYQNNRHIINGLQHSLEFKDNEISQTMNMINSLIDQSGSYLGNQLYHQTKLGFIQGLSNMHSKIEQFNILNFNLREQLEKIIFQNILKTHRMPSGIDHFRFDNRSLNDNNIFIIKRILEEYQLLTNYQNLLSPDVNDIIEYYCCDFKKGLN